MLGGSGWMRLRDMHAQTQRGQHLEHGGKARVAVGRQRLVQPFAAQSGIARGLGHAARARHFAQRLGDEGGIVAGLFNGGFDERRAIFRCLQPILYGRVLRISTMREL